jgi:hypothetical protein
MYEGPGEKLLEADDLVIALLSRLEKHLRPVVEIRAEGGTFVMTATDRPRAWVDLAWILIQQGDHAKRVESSIHAVLDQLQDFVIETIHGRWPTPQDPSVLRDPIPTLHVVHQGSRFRMLFGPPEDPVLELDPIDAEVGPS